MRDAAGDHPALTALDDACLVPDGELHRPLDADSPLLVRVTVGRHLPPGGEFYVGEHDLLAPGHPEPGPGRESLRGQPVPVDEMSRHAYPPRSWHQAIGRSGC